MILPDALCLTLTDPLRYNFYAKFISRIGGVAQLGERLTGSQEVMGSIPTVSTKMCWWKMQRRKHRTKCGVFTYNVPFLEWKSCKNSIFQNFSFAPREATFLRCALPNLWSGVTRTPRLKNKENQQPLYHPPLFWRVRQWLFLSDGSRTHNLKWAL